MEPSSNSYQGADSMKNSISSSQLSVSSVSQDTHGYEFAGWGSTSRLTDLFPRETSVHLSMLSAADASHSVEGEGYSNVPPSRSSSDSSASETSGLLKASANTGTAPTDEGRDGSGAARRRCARPSCGGGGGGSGSAEHKKLGVWLSTAIAGNDVTSSVLFVSGIAAQYAGPYTPVSLALVCVLLYFYRGVYIEVGSALPLNGGTYTLLLNTTTKFAASLTACLTLLSYTATAVVGAASAMEYLLLVWPTLNVFWGTIILLAAFALLNLVGLTESSIVAAIIFSTHMLVMTAVILACTVAFARNPQLLVDNWHIDLPFSAPWYIFVGFAASLVGVSGFESAANYIEEQKEGVFPKTLRNLWVAVTALNPLVGLLSWCVLPAVDILNPSGSASLVARMARVSGGAPLEYIVVIDATLVLAGSILTSVGDACVARVSMLVIIIAVIVSTRNVGVLGLVKRMAEDGVLPAVLLQQNRCRRTPHFIILGFLGVCVSIYAILRGNIVSLSVTFSIAFLSVMSMFALGNMLLKYKRGRVPREARSWWGTVFIAWAMMVTGLFANILLNVDTFAVFFVYYAVAVAVVLAMFARTRLLKMALYFGDVLMSFRCCGGLRARYQRALQNAIVSLSAGGVVFFTKDDNVSVMNKAVLYCRDNEATKWIRVVHCYESEDNVPPLLDYHVRMLDQMYPKIKIDLLLVKGSFDPATVAALSERLQVPRNMMFITCPSERFSHRFGTLGGVRIITA